MIKGNRHSPADGSSATLMQDEKSPQHNSATHTAEAGGRPAADGPQTERNRGDSMTSRERSTPDSGLAPPQPAHAPQSAPLSGLVWTAASGSSLWEQWYSQASAEQRKQLLDQAGRQGLLCTHQLPPPQGQNDTPARRALLNLLAG